MVVLDGIPCGNARHDGLISSGITGEIVILDVAEADAAVRFNYRTENVDRCASGSRADMNSVVYVGVDAADTVIHRVADHITHALLGVSAVRSERENDRDIGILHACRGELVEHSREHLVARDRACDVGCDDRDGLAGLYDFTKRRKTDRLTHGAVYFVTAGKADLCLVRRKNRHDLIIRYLYRDLLFSKT